MPTPSRLIADRSYDARKLRDWLSERGCDVVIPPNPTRKNPYPWDPILYRARNVVERMFCRLKDFSRTRGRTIRRQTGTSRSPARSRSPSASVT